MAQTQARHKENPNKGAWKSFFHLAKCTRLPYFWIAILILVNLGFAQLYLMFPNATQRIMAGDISRNAITAMVVIIFLQALVSGVQTFLSYMTQAKITLSFRKTILKKTLELPMPYFDQNMASRLISRNTEDTTKLSALFGSVIPSIPGNLYQFFGTFVILFSYNWRLVVLAVVMIPLVWLVVFLAGRVNFKWNNILQTRLAELTSYLSEILTNIPLVKVFVKEKTEEKRGQENINEIYKTKKQAGVLSSLIDFLYSSNTTIQIIIAVLGGAWLVSKEYITLDVWIAFYLYAQNLMNSYAVFTTIWGQTKGAQGSARRIAQISMEKSEDVGGSLKVGEQAGNLVFEDVTFRYDRDVILNHVDLRFPKAKVTAVVGRSGAGKSTIFGLLERFYLPESGEIRLDGKAAEDYDLASWRRAIGYVQQNSPVFSGSIRDNMTYGLNREVSEKELVQAAKDANLYDFICSSEKGFDTEVGERGNKLSGGQRQRVAIARTLLKDPKILLLDEATANLDPESTAEVEKALDRLKKGRTTIVVAHQLQSIQDADQIIVLDKGKISGCGTHEELIRENTLYRSLTNIQNKTRSGNFELTEGSES